MDYKLYILLAPHIKNRGYGNSGRYMTHHGPLFYRYNNDGYGEKRDGSPFDGSGSGRLWPLLAGERGIYEIMAGHNADIFIKALEGAANEGGMIPEQVWDTNDISEKGLYRGRCTGSATPLMWSHAEYIKLLRTKRDGKGCDIIPEVYDRYVTLDKKLQIAYWKSTKTIKWVMANRTLRIIAFEPGRLLWTVDNWQTTTETPLRPTGLGLFYADFQPFTFKAPTRFIFSFYWERKEVRDGRENHIDIW